MIRTLRDRGWQEEQDEQLAVLLDDLQQAAAPRAPDADGLWWGFCHP